MTEYIYEGLLSFVEARATGKYRWHFEDPKKQHRVIKEHVVKTNVGTNALVVEVYEPNSDERDKTHLSILGYYNGGDDVQIIPSMIRKGVVEDIKRRLSFTGKVYA